MNDIAKGLTGVQVGDTLVRSTWTHTGAVASYVTVAKVGRKYLKIELDGIEYWSQFRIEDGRQVCDAGYADHLYTTEQHQDLLIKNAAGKALRREGIDIAHHVLPGLSSSQLVAILDIVNPDWNQQ